jgi:hypothetical protein
MTHSTKFTLPFLLLVLVLCFGLLSACASSEDEDEQQRPSYPYSQMAPRVPPPPLDERVRHVSPDPPNIIWRPGHWEYEKDQFVWYEGYFMTRPNPTAVWSSDRWEYRNFGWVFVPGYWQ